MKLLVPVDGSKESLRAVTHAVQLAASGIDVHVVLINVQPALSADVSRFVSGEVLADYHQEKGEEALVEARRMLGEAGVANEMHVVVGATAASIVAQSAEHGCDGICMGSQGGSGLSGLLLGSTAMRVAQLSKVPVTLVP